MNYKTELEELRKKYSSQDAKDKRICELMGNWPLPDRCPDGTPRCRWPDGMPSSLDPKLILIGISSGNSDQKEDKKMKNSLLNPLL